MVRSLPTATLLAAFLLAASAQAADPAATPRPTTGAADRAQAAASVLHAIDVDSSVRPMALRMAGFIAEQVAQWQVTPEQQPQVNAALTKIQDLLIVELSWPSVAKDYIGVYSETFSTVQLQEIAAFFATPTGRKYIATVPALQAQALVRPESPCQRAFEAPATPCCVRYPTPAPRHGWAEWRCLLESVRSVCCGPPSP